MTTTAAPSTARLWVSPSAAGDPTWTNVPLEDTHAVGPATILRGVIIGPAAVRVNGEPLATGIRVLRDRDELCIETARHFFSTEELAAVTTAPEFASPTKCPRCTIPIPSGSPVVRCPQCKLFHHQNPPEKPCWTYAPRCANCDQPTALDAGYRFRPESV
jgi:hypothetical protein